MKFGLENKLKIKRLKIVRNQTSDLHDAGQFNPLSDLHLLPKGSLRFVVCSSHITLSIRSIIVVECQVSFLPKNLQELL